MFKMYIIKNICGNNNFLINMCYVCRFSVILVIFGVISVNIVISGYSNKWYY